jgi:PilZ domain
MSYTEIEQSIGPRFLVNLPVRAEWDEESTGKHVVAEGITENIGPSGAMVTFERLPAVGSRIRISVPGEGGSHIETVAEVVRLVRDLRQPLASLSIIKSKKEWRGMVWEPARLQATQAGAAKDDPDATS